MPLAVNIQARLDEEMSRQLGTAWLDNARLRLALDEALTAWRREIDRPAVVGVARLSLIAHIEQLRRLLDPPCEPAIHPSTARGAEFKVAAGGRFEQRHSMQGPPVPDHGLRPVPGRPAASSPATLIR